VEAQQGLKVCRRLIFVDVVFDISHRHAETFLHLEAYRASQEAFKIAESNACFVRYILPLPRIAPFPNKFPQN
jgi:hypothetical protein